MLAFLLAFLPAFLQLYAFDELLAFVELLELVAFVELLELVEFDEFLAIIMSSFIIKNVQTSACKIIITQFIILILLSLDFQKQKWENFENRLFLRGCSIADIITKKLQH